MHALQVLSGRTVIAVYCRLRSLKFAKISSESHDLAGSGLPFFFAPPISPVFLFIYVPVKEQKMKACEGGATLAAE